MCGDGASDWWVPAAKYLCWSFFKKSRYLGFGVFTDIWSMGFGLTSLMLWMDLIQTVILVFSTQLCELAPLWPPHWFTYPPPPFPVRICTGVCIHKVCGDGASDWWVPAAKYPYWSIFKKNPTLRVWCLYRYFVHWFWPDLTDALDGLDVEHGAAHSHLLPDLTDALDRLM